MRLPLTVRWTTGAAVVRPAPNPGRQFPRCLLLPPEGREGRLAHEILLTLPNDDHSGRTRPRTPASAACSARSRRRSAVGVVAAHRALRIPSRRRRKISFAGEIEICREGSPRFPARRPAKCCGAEKHKEFSFFLSFLLAHCGGGQDKRGCLAPQRSAPAQFFFSVFFLLNSSLLLFTSC